MSVHASATLMRAHSRTATRFPRRAGAAARLLAARSSQNGSGGETRPPADAAAGPAGSDAASSATSARRRSSATPAATPSASRVGPSGTLAGGTQASGAELAADVQDASAALAGDAEAAATGLAADVEDATAALAGDARAVADDAQDAAAGVVGSLVQQAQAAGSDAADAARGLADSAQGAVQEGVAGLADAAEKLAAAADAAVAPLVPTPDAINMGGYRAAPEGFTADDAAVERLKVSLLGAVASLDRGLAANAREAQEVDAITRKLERAGGPVALSWKVTRSAPAESSMDLLSGTWRLIYSSGFNSGSLGGRRPGPPAALVPTVLGQIYQVIDGNTATLDNVVELIASYGLPQLPSFLSGSYGAPEPAPGVRLTLRHDLEMVPGPGASAGGGADPGNVVRIVFEDTKAQLIGPAALAQLPALQAPQLPDFLKPPRSLRSASFAVTFLDGTMRVTRGDRGELRIYLRDEDLHPTTAMESTMED